MDQVITPKSKRPVAVFLGGFEFPNFNAAAVRITAVAKLFHEAGCDCLLIGVSREPNSAATELSSVLMEHDSLDVWEIGYPKNIKEWLVRLISVPSSVKKLLLERYPGQVPIIVCYNYPAIAQWQAKKLAHSMGGKAIADVTEWYGDRKLTSISSIVKNIDTTLRMHVVNSKMDGLCSASPFITEYYKNRTPALIQFPTLIDPDEKPDPLTLSCSPDGMPKRLFFAGSGFDPAVLKHERSGLKDRLDWVLELLADAHRSGSVFILDVYGVSLEQYLVVCPWHAPLLRELGETVIFHGRCARVEVIECLRQADFSIFLRKSSRVTEAGFPTKFSEALTHGTPVLTNAMRNLDGFLVEGETGYALDFMNRSLALATLIKVLALPADQVLKMKRYSVERDYFAPARYVNVMQVFLQKLGMGGK